MIGTHASLKITQRRMITSNAAYGNQGRVSDRQARVPDIHATMRDYRAAMIDCQSTLPGWEIPIPDYQSALSELRRSGE